LPLVGIPRSSAEPASEWTVRGRPDDLRRLCDRASAGGTLSTSETARLLGISRQAAHAAERRALKRLGLLVGTIPRRAKSARPPERRADNSAKRGSITPDATGKEPPAVKEVSTDAATGRTTILFRTPPGDRTTQAQA